MRKIIDGKVYDTLTAAMVCDISGHGNTYPINDFNWECTHLYKSPKGQFFIAGEGGAMSRWAASFRQTGHTAGHGLRLVTYEEARAMCEEHGTHEEYLAVFNEPEEG